MGATFSRLKNWTTEILTNTDLNQEIDNILNNLDPEGVDDYSQNAPQMRTQTSPGTVGSESLATSLAGELERLRYVIQRMIGSSTTYWYEPPPSTLTDLVAALGTGLPTNRIVSGQTTGNSSQLCALVPSGVSASVTLTASVTPFVYYISGVQYSITANVTLTGLSLAPSTQNTCSLNGTVAAGQQWTKFLGMYGTNIDVDGMNVSMAAAVGQIAGFKAGNEYFTAYVDSTSSLTNAWRGSLFNQSAANVTAAGLSDNAEIKLMRLTWIFANTNSSLAVTYTNPLISARQPTSPNTGDYWFDLSTTAWKTFNSTTWVAANATLIGITLQDTANCVAARTFDSYKAMSSCNTIALDYVSGNVAQARDPNAEVVVFGNTSRFGPSKPSWDITSDLKSGVSETSSTTYYLYMKETGRTVISDEAPINRKDLQGLYHPGETWRCLGSVYNNSSTAFDVASVNTYRDIGTTKVLMGEVTGYSFPNSTAADVLPSVVFPDQYVRAANSQIVFTAAQGLYQPIATISVTRGLWNLTAVGRAAITGTANSAATWFLYISDTNNDTAGAGLIANSRVAQRAVAGIVNAGDTSYIIDCPVFSNGSTNFYLMTSVDVTAGAAYVVLPTIRGTRIDDVVGMPR